MNDDNNPLLRHLRFADTPGEIIDSLRYTGLESINIEELSLMERFEYLRGEAVPYEPTYRGINLAMTLQSMIRSSYRSRNPTVIDNKRQRMSPSEDEANADIDLLLKRPIGQTNCLLVTGIPGLGKTQAIARYLSNFPQVIQHGEDTEAGWISQSQVVYLHVGMSHDGSRSGLLESILVEIDGVLGTTFAEDYRKLVKVEKIAVHVIKCLKQHFLGVLVIDEIQEKNLIKSGQAGEMQTFLLTMINSGLPIVFVGNPAGFSWIDGFGQVEQRADERGDYSFHPCGAIENDSENNWEAVFNGISRYYVLPSPVINLDACSAALLTLSGGIPRLALSLWRKTQDLALQVQKESINSSDLYATYNSRETSDRVRFQAEGFNTKNTKILATYKDMNSAYYESIWRTSENDDEGSSDGGIGIVNNRSSSPSSSRKMRSEKSKLKAKQSRQKRKEEKRKELAETLTAEDLRKKGVQEVLLDGLSQLSTDLDPSSV